MALIHPVICQRLVLLVGGLATGELLWQVPGRAIAQLTDFVPTIGAHLGALLLGIGKSGLGDRAWDGWQRFAFLNAVFGLVNLLPLHPFDGGRIAVILLRKFGDARLEKGKR